jgi:integrase
MAGTVLTIFYLEAKMKSQEVNFDKVLDSYEKALSSVGFGYSSRLRMLKRAGRLVQQHERAGLSRFSDEIVAEYFRDVDQRLYEGRIGVPHSRELTRDIQRLLQFVETGNVALPYPLKGSRFTLTAEFQRIAESYLDSGEYHPNTRNDMRWVAHKYFAWLAENGFEGLGNVGAAELQRFLLDCSTQLSPNSMHDVKLYLKKLYAYLYAAKLSESPYAELLSFRVNRETKIYPALPMAEVSKLLDSIDRRTALGKRAYAAMALGAELGMRACDVANLKLGDIDWIRGEIKIVQSKTKKTVVLPLTQKVGEALEDYILNGRPETDERHVFLRLMKPYTPLKAAVTIGEIYRDCCKSAGLEISKAFHTLRRSLATAMVTGGVELTMTAQVLGDSKLDSTNKYISLDSKNLKKCALPFDDISPNGGDV